MSDFFLVIAVTVGAVWLLGIASPIARAAAGSAIMRAIGILIFVAFFAMFAPMAAAWVVVLGIVAAVAHLATARTISR